MTHIDGHGTVTLPADYVREHVRLGYAATEPGNQSDTETASITLATPATTGRGLYVGDDPRSAREPRPGRHRHPRPRRSPRRPRRRSSPPTAPTSPPRPNAASSPNKTASRQPAAEMPDPRLVRRPPQRCRSRVASTRPTRSSGPKRNALSSNKRSPPRSNDSPPPTTRASPTTPSSKPPGGSHGRQRDPTRRPRPPRRVRSTSPPVPTRRPRRLPTSGSALPNRNSLAPTNKPNRPTGNEREHNETSLPLATPYGTDDMWDRWNYHPERLHEAETRIDALDTWKQWAQGHPVDREQLADTVEVAEPRPRRRHRRDPRPRQRRSPMGRPEQHRHPAVPSAGHRTARPRHRNRLLVPARDCRIRGGNGLTGKADPGSGRGPKGFRPTTGRNGSAPSAHTRIALGLVGRCTCGSPWCCAGLKSSRSHIAYFVCVLPGRGFFVCENLSAASMPPTSTSVRASRLASCDVLCEQNVRSVASCCASGWLVR